VELQNCLLTCWIDVFSSHMSFLDYMKHNLCFEKGMLQFIGNTSTWPLYI
jgi:hypothetical protein